ncbi:MAG TPA: type II toxin-antitoxin system HipA family toxin [Thermodesulfovibrionales bacterium]|nr:type II toxin-antitoxin system HipA family toxin [Thermodesulfovibrionales bacterium]
MTAELDVYFQNDLMGHLWLDSRRRFTFRYDQTWLTKLGAIPLSLSLPLKGGAFEDDASRPFFANLLPEADVRRAVARRLGISEHNDFALLEAIGGECAGAVTVLPAGALLSHEGRYRPIDEKELHEIVVSLPVKPFLAGEEGLRLSLAGAQNKLPVYVEGNGVFLPMGSYPSSHILKPPIRDWPETVENEAFCMALAGRLGLPVPSAMIRKGIDTLYLVERYDRKRDETGRLIRLHQEDFCQALGIPPDQKYESEGGSSLCQCFSLLSEKSIRPSVDRKLLLNWVVFNYLTGNADAHAKNIALLLTADGPLLAPFYDLLCTGVYKELTDKLSMKIGGENRPDWIQLRHWQRFADDAVIKPKLVIGTLQGMAEKITIVADGLANEFRGRYGETPVLDAILDVIKDRSHRAMLYLKA